MLDIHACHTQQPPGFQLYKLYLTPELTMITRDWQNTISTCRQNQSYYLNMAVMHDYLPGLSEIQ